LQIWSSTPCCGTWDPTEHHRAGGFNVFFLSDVFTIPTFPRINSLPLNKGHLISKGHSSSNYFSGATVDGQNPAPADMVNYPIIYDGF